MDRPLPYLIGSRAFMEQDDVGLGDLSSDGKIFIMGSRGVVTLDFLPHIRVCLSRSVRGQ